MGLDNTAKPVYNRDELCRGAAVLISADGRTWRISSERMGRIILWLLNRAERIDNLERVRITFNCAGGTVSTELVEAELA